MTISNSGLLFWGNPVYWQIAER